MTDMLVPEKEAKYQHQLWKPLLAIGSTEYLEVGTRAVRPQFIISNEGMQH